MVIDIDDPKTWETAAEPEVKPPVPVKKKKRAIDDDGEVEEKKPLKITLASGRIVTTSETPQVLVDGTIQVVSVTRTEKGMVMRCNMRRAWDSETSSADLTPKIMEYHQHWNEWFSSKSGINARLEPRTRQLLKDYVFEQAEALPECIGVDRSGYLEDLDVLAFENGWVGSDGVLHVTSPVVPSLVLIGGRRGPAKKHLVNMQSPTPDAPKLGFPIHEAMSLPRNNDPAGRRAAAQYEARGVINQLLDAARENYGNNVVRVVLGYFFAHAVAPYVFKKHHRFPHLYITGPYQTGKDWLARLAWTVAGGKDGASTSAGGGSTAKGVRNRLSAASLLPLHINELRGLKDEEYLTKFIRAGYDRQGSTITNIEQQDISFPVNRSFMLVGERVVGAGAELSRYVSVETRGVKRPEKGQEVMMLANAARSAWSTLLCDWHVAAPHIEAMITSVQSSFAGSGLDDRRAFGWACVVAGASWLAAATEEDPLTTCGEPFIAECIDRARASASAAEEAGIAMSFWDSLYLLVQQGKVFNTGAYAFIRAPSPTEIFVDVARITSFLKDMSRSGDESVALMRNELRRVSAFIGTARRPIGGIHRTCNIYNARDESVAAAIPDWMLKLACTSDHGIFDEDLHAAIVAQWKK